jgi:surface antigen
MNAFAPPGRTRRTGIIGAALIGGALMIAPSVATAMPPPCDAAGNPCPTGAKMAKGRVDVAAGNRLTVRRRPRTDAKKRGSRADGATILISCQILGDRVSGTFGTSSLWDKIKSGGYVSDTYVATGSDGRVAPECPPIHKAHPTPHPQPTDPSPGKPRSVTLHNDYPYASASPQAADPWGFYYRECTSFVAYRLNRLKNFNFSNRMQGGHFGDAGNWDNNARALGFKVNNKPTVGSVMVRDSGTWGHVAIVAKVKPKKFLVEEFNHNVSHGYGQRWLSRSSSSSDWDHFIHFRQ